MKALNHMLEVETNYLYRSLRRYITLCRLSKSNNDALISNFETNKWATLRSYDNIKNYEPYVPTNSYINNIIADIREKVEYGDI